MSIAILAMACFFTWFCHKRREILLSMVAAILWLGLSMWFFFYGGDSALFPLDRTYSRIIAWAFFILMFVPLLFAMNVEIQHEAGGKRWKKWDTEPKEKVTPEYDLYREKLYNKTRKGRRR